MPPNLDGFDSDGRVSLLGKIVLAAFHLSMLLRAAALDGESVSVDLVTRTDESGTEYVDIVVVGEVDVDSGGEGFT